MRTIVGGCGVFSRVLAMFMSGSRVLLGLFMFTDRVMMLGLMMMLSSCKAWNSLFGPKYGCPTNGKNVGAEKIVSGDPKAIKAARKAKKFKS